MTRNEKTGSKVGEKEDIARERTRDRPEWAAGLRKLYDSVVDEPLPDNFKDLLSQLDDGSGSKDG